MLWENEEKGCDDGDRREIHLTNLMMSFNLHINRRIINRRGRLMKVNDTYRGANEAVISMNVLRGKVSEEIQLQVG